MKKFWMLPALALMLGACSSPHPAPGAPAGGTGLGTGSLPLSGRIVNYNPATGTTLKAFSAASGSVVSSGAVDGNGNFTITIPTPTNADLFTLGAVGSCGTDPTQTRNVVVNPTTAHIASFDLSLHATDTASTNVLLVTNPTASSGTLATYVYADADVDVTGSSVCGATTPVTSTLDLHFKKGWNVMVEQLSLNGPSGIQISFTSASSAPSGLDWYDLGNLTSVSSKVNQLSASRVLMR